MPATETDERTVNVHNCPRCGEEHGVTPVTPLDSDGADTNGAPTHYATCPETGQPISMKVNIEVY